MTGEHLHEENNLTEQIASNERDHTLRFFLKKNVDVSGIYVSFPEIHEGGWVC